MLDLEFVQFSHLAGNFVSGPNPHNRHSVVETRPVAQSNLVTQKRDSLKREAVKREAVKREARDRVWFFALSGEPSGGPSTASASHGGDSIQALAMQFRSAPAGEPVGVTLGKLMQHARQSSLVQGSAGNQALVACAVCFDRAVVAHRGDACCYLIRHNHATRLTLGNVELVDYQVQPGDILLLSDGPVDRDLKGSEMAEIVRHGGDLQAALRQVLALANQRGSYTGSSVIMIRVRGVEKISHARRAQATR